MISDFDLEGKNSAGSRKSFWPKSVTYASGMICNLCVRAGPINFWRRRRDSNPRDPFESNGFQDRRFQPLTHSSTCDSNALAGGGWIWRSPNLYGVLKG